MEPAPAPNPGLTVETFDRIQLSPRPGEGQTVPGWFPILQEQYNGMTWELVESAPEVFQATQGFLRFYDSGSREGLLGRVRQVPEGTNEICVDVYIPSEMPPFMSFGMAANTLETGYAIYGMTLSKQLILGSAEEGASEDLPAEPVFVVSGPGFYEELQGDFGDQWVRLCMKIDEEANILIASVNGEVIFEGFPKIRIPRIIDEPEPFPPLPLFTDAGIIGGLNSILSDPEVANGDLFTEVLAFFDNFSFGPVQGGFDVTVGPGAGARGRVGEDVISAAMKRQKISLSGTANETLSAYFGIENESGVTTEASLRSRVSNARSIGYRAYLENGGGRSNVTSSLRSGRLSTDIGGGDTAVVVCEASLKGRIRQIVARSRGAVKRGSFGLVARSASNPSAIDSASAILEFNSLIPINRRGR
ncbi:MAG: hypothetical protein KDN18_12430 [Verrucomicrobiae bacterium]|nr:hypothetical protein [Verrucomicrobiae bacterium]